MDIPRLIIKAGMKAQDVINSDVATQQQKKLALIFDADGIQGYSQREADVFNATDITEKEDGCIVLSTKLANGKTKSSTLCGDVADFKYAPSGEVKPYTKAEIVKEGWQARTPHSGFPVGEVIDGVAVTFKTKQDNKNFHNDNSSENFGYEDFYDKNRTVCSRMSEYYDQHPIIRKSKFNFDYKYVELLLKKDRDEEFKHYVNLNNLNLRNKKLLKYADFEPIDFDAFMKLTQYVPYEIAKIKTISEEEELDKIFNHQFEMHKMFDKYAENGKLTAEGFAKVLDELEIEYKAKITELKEKVNREYEDIEKGLMHRHIIKLA